MVDMDQETIKEQMDIKKIQEMWTKRKWWEKVVIGIIAIIFGIVAFAWPDITLEVIIYLFGFFAVVIGILSLITGIVGSELGNARWVFVLQGILGIIIGIMALAWPGITYLFFAYLIGFWAIMFGIFEIIGSFAAPKEVMVQQNMSKGLLVISGIISLLFGFLIVAFPGSGIVAILWIIAAYAIIFGIINVVMGFQDRNVPPKAA